jgi:hypothetical protein
MEIELTLKPISCYINEITMYQEMILALNETINKAKDNEIINILNKEKECLLERVYLLRELIIKLNL